jgi:hypothetical protein
MEVNATDINTYLFVFYQISGAKRPEELICGSYKSFCVSFKTILQLF